MSIANGTSPIDGSETIVLILEHTPKYQLDAVQQFLQKELSKLSCHDEDGALWAGIFHLLCDLETEGFEA